MWLNIWKQRCRLRVNHRWGVGRGWVRGQGCNCWWVLAANCPTWQRSLAALAAQMRKADALAQLGGIEDQLDREAKEDESARRQYGSRWPMAASYVANGELRDRLAGYR